jgi:hypothetical protein
VFAQAPLVVQHDQVDRRQEQSSPIGVIHSVTLDDISYSAPALASWQGRMYLAWTGGDGRICVQTSADGHHFSEPVSLVYESYGLRPADTHTRKSRLGSRAPFPLPANLALRTGPTFPRPPALAATEYGVDMAWRDPDRRIRILRATPDGEPREIILPETSAVAPSIAGLGRLLALAWTGWDGHINVVNSHDESLHPPVRLDHTSANSPALCTLEGELVVAWTGTDRHINIDPPGTGPFGHPQRLEETSDEAPAIGAIGRRIALAWTGADDHVNIAVMHDGGSRSEGVRLDWTTFYSPAVTAHGGHFVLAWTGSDGRISLASLRI